MLRNALLAAAVWSWGGSPPLDHTPTYTQAVADIYRRYFQLLQTLFGAEIVLEENPISWNPQPLAQAELFRSRETGNLLVAVVQNSGYLHSGITLRIRSGSPVHSARCLDVNREAGHAIEFQQEGEELCFHLPDNFLAVVLALLP